MFANVGLKNALLFLFFKAEILAFCVLEVNRYLWLCLVLMLSSEVFFEVYRPIEGISYHFPGRM